MSYHDHIRMNTNPPTDDYSTRRLALETSKYTAAMAAGGGFVEILGNIYGTPLPGPIAAVATIASLGSMLALYLTAVHAGPLLGRLSLWLSTREYRAEG